MFRLKTLLLGLALVFATGNALAQNFKADMRLTTPEDVVEGVMYRQGDQLRQELRFPETSMIIISDVKTGRTLNLDIKGKVYMERPGGQSMEPEERLAAMADKTDKGEEEYGGYMCDVASWKYHQEQMGVMTQWKARDLDFPIKTRNELGNGAVLITEITNIVTGDQDPSLFTVPKDFKKIDMPQMGGPPPGAAQ